MTSDKKGDLGRREDEARLKIQKFLQGRRNPDTRQYVEKIIEYLENVRKKDTDRKKPEREVGWVRVKDLLGEFVGEGKLIKNGTTFYRLIADLSQDLIIDKQTQPMPHEKGRQATFYRTLSKYRREWIFSRDGLESAYAERMACIHDLIEQLIIAQKLLMENGCPNPHEIIIERFKHQRKKKPSCSAALEPNLIQEFRDEKGNIDYQGLINKIATRGQENKGSTL
ncbi:hypothetical protein [Methanoregula sp.]|jgi:hypothetical protein|uniref:hypothetical protein n=1 Tax=Methanoregula sp. TaxID=2052170 RepID=UPI003C25C6C7